MIFVSLSVLLVELFLTRHYNKKWFKRVMIGLQCNNFKSYSCECISISHCDKAP